MEFSTRAQTMLLIIYICICMKTSLAPLKMILKMFLCMKVFLNIYYVSSGSARIHLGVNGTQT